MKPQRPLKDDRPFVQNILRRAAGDGATSGAEIHQRRRIGRFDNQGALYTYVRLD